MCVDIIRQCVHRYNFISFALLTCDANGAVYQ